MNQKTIISSTNNAGLKNLSLLLKKAKERQEQGIYVIEGLKMFEEALDAGLLVKAYASESFYHNKLSENQDYFANFDFDIITDSLFNSVSETKTPQGIMATVKQKKYSLESILETPDAHLLVLEDIRDPGNLGTMIRTAEGAGISGIILNSSCVDVYNPKVIRSTMGSIYRVPLYIAKNFIDVLQEVKKHDINIVAAHLKGIHYDTEGSFGGKCAILIGNEANGLSEEASAFSDTLIKIPMAGKVESLNAAVAAAILMYEAARQRKN